MGAVQVYFMEAVGIDRIKIGQSGDVQQRFIDIQVACPFDLKLLGATAIVTEDFCHRRFRHLWCRGEWFFATAELREFITDVLNPNSGLRPYYFKTVDRVLEAARAAQETKTGEIL